MLVTFIRPIEIPGPLLLASLVLSDAELLPDGGDVYISPTMFDLFSKLLRTSVKPMAQFKIAVEGCVSSSSFYVELRR